MTIAFSEVPDGTRFLIQSGSGYFIRFENLTPVLSSVPSLASDFNFYEALGVLLEMEKLGYQAALVIQPGRQK
jgi:hypothetical protein